MAGQPEAVNLEEKFGLFADRWSPRIVAQINDYHVKIAKVAGEFIWHSHPETDEMFLVHKGKLRIELREKTVGLSAGELYVVPAGVEHRPVAEGECEIVMFEPAGTLNTGDTGGERSVEQPPWI